MSEPATRVQQAVRAFSESWGRGEAPSLEAALGASCGEEREALFQALLAAEIRNRREKGERPGSEEFIDRFPDFAPAIEAVFRVPGDAPTMLTPTEVPSRGAVPGRHAAHAAPAVPVLPESSRYEIFEEAGRGGMGAVYRARHKTLDREVALKVLLPGHSSQGFEREARLLARIRSPNVVAVYDFEILPDGRLMLAMEWIDGCDLSRRMQLNGGRLAEADALALMRQVCEGMLAAHEQGIIHRDLKPSNILVDRMDAARVADFGLASDDDARQEAGEGILGTPWYMAPEQAEDPSSADTRSDIYSFGATFYHALTGHPPFEGPSALAVLRKHKTEPLTAPQSRNPALTDTVSEVIERCLAKSPGDRFLSFEDLLRQLSGASAGHSPWEETSDPRLAPFLERYRIRREAILSAPDFREERFIFPDGRQLRILRGDMAEQDVDAVVSSDDTGLSMTSGVSRAILEAAGPVIAEEARRYRTVRPGRAVVTSGGRLKARYVFHGVTLRRLSSGTTRPSRDIISEILGSCFYHAESLQIRSIAFPLLGTGTGGFSKEICLDTLFRSLAKALIHSLTPIQDARIIIKR